MRLVVVERRGGSQRGARCVLARGGRGSVRGRGTRMPGASNIVRQVDRQAVAHFDAAETGVHGGHVATAAARVEAACGRTRVVYECQVTRSAEPSAACDGHG